MLLPRYMVWLFAIGMAVLDCASVRGQDYPRKPIRIVTSETGGAADFVSRLVAQELTASLGQQVIVDNRGGSDVVPAQLVAKAPADGYTLRVSTSILWILPFLQANVPYDPIRDFSPIALIVASPNVLVVHPSLTNSVKELIAIAKSKPGSLNYASGPTGGANHLAAELFKSMAGVDLVRVSYKGGAAALNDLIGGQVQLMFPTIASSVAHIKSGRLKALAVTSAQPSALLPGFPTVASSGLPGYESVAPYSTFAPARTSAAIINRLNAEIVRAVNNPDVKQKLFNASFEIVGSSPAQLAAVMKSDMERMGKVIRDAGIKAE